MIRLALCAVFDNSGYLTTSTQNLQKSLSFVPPLSALKNKQTKENILQKKTKQLAGERHPDAGERATGWQADCVGKLSPNKSRPTLEQTKV